MRKLKGSVEKPVTDVHVKGLKIPKAIVQGQLLYRELRLAGKALF